MYNKVFLLSFLFFFCVIKVKAQTVTASDSIRVSEKITRLGGEMYYDVGKGRTLVYSKPKKFGFVLNLPKDAGGIVSTTFSKKSIKPLLLVGASTAVLYLADREIMDGVRQFSDNINLHPEEKNTNLLNFKMGDKNVSLFRLPANLNTAFYQLGQGFPSLVIGAGLFTYGKIKNDYRALSTASQLAESFILMGVGTQIIKRVTGRQSPSEAHTGRGKWDFLPSFSEYQNRTPNYDAFPSGHLATLMSSVTIFADNYPEKRWIKPVGYSLTGLVAYSMMNNEVHWASDYPLAIAMGYLCARQVIKNNRRIINSTTGKKRRGQLNYTCNYINRTIMPGLVYKF